MTGSKGNSGKYARTPEMCLSQKKRYDNPDNREKARLNLRRASTFRNKESWDKMADTRRKNIALGLAKTVKGQPKTEEHKQKIRESNKIALKKFWEDNDIAVQEKSKSTKEFYEKNPDARVNLSNKIKELWKDEEYKKKQDGLSYLNTPQVKKKKSESARKKWQNREYRDILLSEDNRKKRLNGLMKRPTSFEQKISDLCFKYNLPFVYRGDGSFLINFKNPDFVNEKDKVVIEVFYSYFKIRDYSSVENYKVFCKKRYEPAGWKVIFIDELDLSGDKWEEVCLSKITGEDYRVTKND